MLRVLEEFYDEYHEQIYEYQTELLEDFLENKNNWYEEGDQMHQRMSS